MQESKSSALHATNCTAYHLLLVECRVSYFNVFVVCAHPAWLRSFQQVSDSWTCHLIKYPRFHPNLRDWRRSPAWTFRLIRWEISFQLPSLEWSRSRSLILISPVSIRPLTSRPPTSIFITANSVSITVTDLFCFVFDGFAEIQPDATEEKPKPISNSFMCPCGSNQPDTRLMFPRSERGAPGVWQVGEFAISAVGGAFNVKAMQSWKTTIDLLFCRVIRW